MVGCPRVPCFSAAQDCDENSIATESRETLCLVPHIVLFPGSWLSLTIGLLYTDWKGSWQSLSQVSCFCGCCVYRLFDD